MAVEEIDAEEPINADATYEPLIEAERRLRADAEHDDKGRGVLRFYELAKKQEWQVRDMPWGEIPPIPETRAGRSKERKERRRAVWRSVITQQLQADEFAVDDGGAAAEPRPAPRGEALLLDDGAGRGAPRRGMAEAGGRRRAGWPSATRTSTSSRG